MDEKEKQKRYNKILKKAQSHIKKVKEVFFNVRSAVSKNNLNNVKIDKDTYCTLDVDTNKEKGVSKYLKVYNNEDGNKLYEIQYGVDGVSIEVGENPQKPGIYYVKFNDFDCKNLEEIKYNHLRINCLECYDFKIDSDGNIKGEHKVVERPNKTKLTKVLSIPVNLMDKITGLR